MSDWPDLMSNAVHRDVSTHIQHKLIIIAAGKM